MNAILSALVNGGILGGVLALLVWAAMKLASRRALNAATRYAIWWMVFLAVIALPLMYWQPVRTAPPQTRIVIAARVTAPPSPAVQFAPSPSPATRPITPTPSHSLLTLFPVRMDAGPWIPYVLALWAMVAGLMMVRLAIGVIALGLRSRRASEAPAYLLAVCPSRRRIRVAISSEIPAPLAAGPWRPSILIPESLLHSFDSAELRRVILHESAHLARYDDWALLAQRSIEAVFTFHPIVRWVARRIDFEREVACDDVVLAASGAARAYAGCLVRMAEVCGHPAALPGAAAVGQRSHLARRVELLLERRRHTGTSVLRTRLAWTLAALVGVTLLALRLPAPIVLAETVRAVTRPFIYAALPLAAVVATPQSQAAPTGFEARVLEDSSGNPLPSAELRFHKAGQIELAADLDTDSQGRAHAPLPPGEYLMDVLKPNFVTTSMKVKAPLSGLTVRLVRYGIISGQVTDQQGQPEPGSIHAPYGRAIGGTRIAILTTNQRGQFQKYRDETLGEEGRYRIYDLPPGQYAIAIAYDGLKDGSGFQMYPDSAHPRIFTVAGGEEYRDINFTVLPRAAFDVSGRVTGGGPKDDFALSLAAPDQPLFPIAQIWTDEGSNGAFHFTKIPAGTYDLFVAGPTTGYGGHEALVSPKNPRFARTRINVGQNVEGLEIPVAEGRMLKLTLRAKGAEQLPGGCPQSASVALGLAEPWGIFTGNNPRVTFGKEESVSGLAPARYQITALSLGTNCFQVNAPIADLSRDSTEPVAIELAAAGSIHGTSRTTGTAIVLLPEDGGDARVMFPDASGAFAFDSLPPGRYRIAARPAAEARSRWVADLAGMQQVEVAGGQSTTVDLEAKR